MTIWFEIGAGTVKGRRVIGCTEVDDERLMPRLLCLFPAGNPDEVREAARWAMRHSAYWRATGSPVTSVAEVVNRFAPLRAEVDR